GLTATATIDGIALKWTNPGLSEFSEIEVHRATSSGGTYTKIAEGRFSAYTDPVTDGSTYYYKVRARHITRQNRFSDFSSVASATAKLVRDYQGGRGVNIMHPRYSTFQELSLPPLATVRADTFHSDLVYTNAPSQRYVRFRKTASGNSAFGYLGDSADAKNIRLNPGQKYIVSFWARGNASAAGSTFSIRFRNADATPISVDTPISGVLAQTPQRFSFVYEAHAEWVVMAVALSASELEPAGDAAIYITGVMIEEQYGNETTPSGYVPPVTTAGSTGIASDGGQVADHRSLRQTSVGNAGSLTNGSPLSATDLGATARISI